MKGPSHLLRMRSFGRRPPAFTAAA